MLAFPVHLEPEQRAALGALPLPLPSARNPRPEGLLGEVTDQVLAPFELSWNDLRVRRLKDVFLSKGTRPALVFPRNLESSLIDDELHAGRRALRMGFELGKGSYATILVKRITEVAGAGVMTIEVLYEDNHCLAVNKPAGLLSQGDETGDPDLVSWARAYLKDRYGKPGNVFVGLVHRLDRPTSGVVLLARTSKAASRLSAQFRTGKIAKVYWAIIEGHPDPPEGRWVDVLDKDRGRNRSRVLDEPEAEGQVARVEYRRGGTLAGLQQGGTAPGDGSKPSAPGPAR